MDCTGGDEVEVGVVEVGVVDVDVDVVVGVVEVEGDVEGGATGSPPAVLVATVGG